MKSKSETEIDHLSIFLIEEFGGTDRNESAVEMAIRLLLDYKAIKDNTSKIAMMKERGC